MSGVVVIPQTISAIGAFSALDPTSADYLQLDPQRCSLPTQGVARTTIERKSETDGVFVESAYEGEQILTLGGDLVITSNGMSSEGAYFTALSTLLTSLRSALDTLKTADGNLVHSGGSTPVRLYSSLEQTWQNFWVCTVTFGLVVHA